MPLPTYTIKINGKYFAGFDPDKTEGKTAHMGWQPKAVELDAVVLVDDVTRSRKLEGNISLKSCLDKIYDRMRYADLKIQKLEVEAVTWQ
jgi:hypothetical protein